MDNDYEEIIQTRLDKAMPWVALYIASASAICTFAMAVDIFNGFRLKKLWFPCKFYSLNAASLTVIAVAIKLPVDIDTIMIKSDADAIAQYMGIIFLVATLTNFMTSLGCMNNGEILSNVTALVIFVLTVAGNIFILIIQFRYILGDYFAIRFLIPNVFMLVSLTMIASLAIVVRSIKRNLELQYREKLKVTLREEREWGNMENVRADDLKKHMIKYLVMAETSNPQFVMGRSAVCSFTASTLFATIIYVLTLLINHPPKKMRGETPYGNYTAWIFIIQSFGVIVGSIAPTFRLFVAVILKCSKANLFKMDFRIEEYWNEVLVEWRDSFSDFQIPENLFIKYLLNLKWFLLSFFIVIQIFILLLSKILLLLFSILMAPLILCYKKVMKRESGGDDEEIRYLKTYVLRLEGEMELPQSIIQDVCRLADQLIRKGRKMQSNNLLSLLHKSTTFNGVGQFDNIRIQSLHSGQEPPNCWTLSIVTITSIAIAIPNIDKHRVKQLLSSVSEGLSLAKVVEKTLIKDDQLAYVRKAAYICWAGVVSYKRWLKINLRDNYIITSSQSVLMLSNRAREIVVEFKNGVQDPVFLEDPINWPARVVAANSMYRICQTLLLSSNGQLTREGFFEQLSIMVADILAACLTNLPHVITAKCHNNAIEKREESIIEAFLLLGKTEQIVELLQQREWPPLDHDRAACIDEWRALF